MAAVPDWVIVELIAGNLTLTEARILAGVHRAGGHVTGRLTQLGDLSARSVSQALPNLRRRGQILQTATGFASPLAWGPSAKLAAANVAAKLADDSAKLAEPEAEPLARTHTAETTTTAATAATTTTTGVLNRQLLPALLAVIRDEEKALNLMRRFRRKRDGNDDRLSYALRLFEEHIADPRKPPIRDPEAWLAEVARSNADAVVFDDAHLARLAGFAPEGVIDLTARRAR